VASILRALGNTTSTEQQAQERIVKQIERYLDLEKMVPCYHNAITVACLQVLSHLQLYQGLTPPTGPHDNLFAARCGTEPRAVRTIRQVRLRCARHVTDTCRYGNYQQVRATALEALIQLGIAPNPRSEQASGLLRHVLECVVRDKSPWLRHRALLSLLAALRDTVLDLPELRQHVFDCIK
jgi:hypothetical protein